MSSETSRIEAFSDGVFSIAATLLVLDLKPPAQGLPFWQGILNQWPGYAGFLLSFLYIGMMWINHHRLFKHIRRTSDTLLVVNLFLLLAVVWIPYPTSLLAQAMKAGQPRDAAILYCASFLVIALLYNLLLYTCICQGLMDRQHAGVAELMRQYLLGPVICLLCLVIAWWSVPLSLVINGAMVLYFVMSPSSLSACKDDAHEAHSTVRS